MMIALKREVKVIPVRKYIIGILYSRGKTTWMPNCSPLCFLTCIFCSLVLFGIVQKIKSIYLRIIIVITACAISDVLSLSNCFKLPWNVDTAFMGILFIYVGYLIKRTKLFERVNKVSNIGLVLILSISLIISKICVSKNPIEYVSFDDNRYGNVLLMISGAVSLCFAIFVLCYKIQWKGLIAKCLSYLGKHTLFIMGFDYFAGTIAYDVLKIKYENWLLVFLIKMIILTIGSLGWNWIVNKMKGETIRKALSF